MNRHAEIETDDNEEGRGGKKKGHLFGYQKHNHFFLLCRKANK